MNGKRLDFSHVLREEDVEQRDRFVREMILGEDWSGEVLEFCRAGGFPEEVSASHVKVDDSEEKCVRVTFRIYYTTPTHRTCGLKEENRREVVYALMCVDREAGDWELKVEG